MLSAAAAQEGLSIAQLIVRIDEARGGIGVNSTDARIGTLSGAYNFAPFRVVAGYINFDDKRVADLDGEGAWIGVDYQTGKTTWKAQFVLN